MSTQTFEVDGMTCGHCASAVTSEVEAVEGVREVSIDLVAGGTSRVTVEADGALSDEQMRTALEEAGSYTLVGA